MIRYNDIRMGAIAIHRVGNKHRAERNFIAEGTSDLEVEIRAALLSYFLKPLKREDQRYRFELDERTGANVIRNAAAEIFIDPESLYEQSVIILHHLYNQSTHPNIKSGELYVAHFTDIIVDDELVNAIGIFKSERRSEFLKITSGGTHLDLKIQDGINLGRLDKGCLILDAAAGDNYRILSVDNNNYDTEYWLRSFLMMEPVKDQVFQTKNFMELCNSFSEEVVAKDAGKGEQMKFIADSVDYFANNEQFDFDKFREEILVDEPRERKFKQFQEDYEFPENYSFEISQPAVSKARKKMSNLIKLDSGVQIKLDHASEAAQSYMEKGFDEQKGMHYYKVFFNEEL